MKKAISLLLVGAMVFMLAACGKPAGEAGDKDQTVSTAASTSSGSSSKSDAAKPTSGGMKTD